MKVMSEFDILGSFEGYEFKRSFSSNDLSISTILCYSWLWGINFD